MRLFLLIILSFPTLVFAQADTLRRYQGGEVVIEKDRAEREYAIPAVAIKSEPTDKLTQLSGSTRASDFIRLLTPSLSLRSYGTLGGITLSSYRGLPPEYTIIFRDGIRLTNEQNSLTDLGRITSASVSRVDLLPSNSSILLGGDAVGASLNLISYRPDRTAISVGSRQTSNDGLRSVGENEYFTSMSYSTGQWGIGGAFNRQTSTGDFTYPDLFSRQEVRRENNDASLTDLVLAGSFRDEALELASTFSYVKAERGAPGAAVIEGRGASQFRARQADEDSYLSLRGRIRAGEWSIDPAIAFQSQFESYADPDVIDKSTERPVFGEHLNRIYFAEIKTNGKLNDNLRAYFGSQLQLNNLFSNQAKGGTDTAVRRTRLGAYAAFSYELIRSLTLNAATRAEWISDLSIWKVLPQMHVQYIWQEHDLTINANYGRSFHAPTFNQLYWQRSGNPYLRHEQGDNYELAAVWRPMLLENPATFRLTGFLANIKDQILWIPQANNLYKAFNLQSARTQGVELRLVYSKPIDDELLAQLDIAYTALDAENLTEGKAKGKRIPYSAKTQSVVSFQLSHIDRGQLGIISEYRGKRYSDVSNDELSSLKPHIVFTASYRAPRIALQQDIGLLLNLSVINLLDKAYSEIPNFPMPGRSVRLGAEIKFSPIND